MPDSFKQLTTGEIRKIVNSGDTEQMAQIPIEDLRIFFENEKQRDLFSMDGVKNLYAGVCERAVDDYKTVHKMTLFRFNKFANVKPSSMEKTLENFFATEFFLNATGLRSKDHAVKVIEQTMIDERKRKLQNNMV